MTTKTIKRIHVNQHNIKANGKDCITTPTGGLPVFTVKNRGKTYIGHKVNIDGISELIYEPQKPLECGAKVWIQTKSKVIIHGTHGPLELI
jgi:hypothetical protein